VTIDRWLRERSSGVPAALDARVREALAGALDENEDRASGHFLDAATALLAEIAADPGRRARALDLLTVDALVTYAFEAAVDSPDELDVPANEAMRRLAALAAGPG